MAVHKSADRRLCTFGPFEAVKNSFQNLIIVCKLRSATIAAAVLLAYCPCASALNPSLDINQYAHSHWTIPDGFFKSVIYSIAQTPDGYLWLGNRVNDG